MPSSPHFFPTLALVRAASSAAGWSAQGNSSVSWLLPCCAGRMGEQGELGTAQAWVCISWAAWLPTLCATPGNYLLCRHLMPALISL